MYAYTHKRSRTTFYFPLFGWKEAQSPLDFKGMLFITVLVTKAWKLFLYHGTAFPYWQAIEGQWSHQLQGVSAPRTALILAMRACQKTEGRQRMLQHVGQLPAPAMGPSQTAHSSVLKGRANMQRIMCNAFLISCTSSGLHLGSKMMALNSLILTRAGVRKAVFTSTIFLNGYLLNKRQLLFLKEKWLNMYNYPL